MRQIGEDGGQGATESGGGGGATGGESVDMRLSAGRSGTEVIVLVVRERQRGKEAEQREARACTRG